MPFPPFLEDKPRRTSYNASMYADKECLVVYFLVEMQYEPPAFVHET